MNEEQKQEGYELAARLVSEQNFAAAMIAGAVATLLSAAAYGITVATWPFSYGFAAAGIGIVAGLSIRFLGRGISTKFAVAAALYTIAAYVLGNLFRVIVTLSVGYAVSPVEILRDHSLSSLVERSFSYFSAIDLVYLSVAVFCAAFLANRSLSRSERLAIGMSKLRD